MRENTDQNNSEYGHFLRSAFLSTSDKFITLLNSRSSRGMVFNTSIWFLFKIHKKTPVSESPVNKAINCTLL